MITDSVDKQLAVIWFACFLVFFQTHVVAGPVDIEIDSAEKLKGVPSLSSMISDLNDMPSGGIFKREAIESKSLVSVIQQNNKVLASLEKAVSGKSKQKEEGISLTSFLGLMGFVLSICKIFYDILAKKSEKRSSKRDNFWLREIIFPRTIGPLDKAILENELRFKDFSKLSQKELEEFIDGFENLRDQVGLVSLLSPDLLDSIDLAIDGLILLVASQAEPGNVYNEKPVTEEPVGDPFLTCYKKIIGHFMDAHQKKEHKMVAV